MSFKFIIQDSDIIDGLSVRYLKLSGLWKVINDYRTTEQKNAILKFHLLVTLLLALPYIFSQIMCYFVIKVDIEKATILNLNAIPACQLCCRFFVFWFCMESQCRLYNLLRKDFLDMPEKNLADVAEVYKRISKTSNFFCTMSFTVNLSIAALYIIFPGISVDYILYHTGNMAAVKTGRMKILGGWYPLAMDRSPYYEIVFVYEILVLFWGAYSLQAYFVLYYQVLMCLCAQFAALGVQISALKPDQYRKITKNERITNKKEDSPMYKELYQILKDHQKLLRYTEELRNVYNPLVTMTLGMGILILIIAAYQFLFAKSGDPVYIFRFLLFMAYQGIEVSLLCFGSSSVETAILQFTYSVCTLMSRMTE